MMPGFVRENLLSLLLAIFFVVGAAANLAGSEQVRQDYEGWGYPAWFNYITGILELLTAVLLVFRSMRSVGRGLAAMIMIAATATVMLNGDYAHALIPLMVLTLVGVDVWRTNNSGFRGGSSTG